MAYPGQKPEVAKAKQRQTFPANRLLEWKENVSKTSGEGAGVAALIERMLQAKTVEEQLKGMKEVGAALKKLDADLRGPPGEAKVCIDVLVAMHSLCLSRHPLQRALTKLLSSLPWKETLRASISARILQMLHGEKEGALPLNDQPAQSHLFSLTSYLEALIENFPLGTLCLQEQLVEVIHCMVQWLSRLAASSKETSSGTSLVVCCKTFLVIVSKYLEPLQAHKVQLSGAGWVESGAGGRTLAPTESVVVDSVGDISNGSETCKAISEPATEDSLSSDRAPYLTEDLHTVAKAIWSILADNKHTSFPDVATTCGMLYIVLLRVTHLHWSELNKTCHQLLKEEGEEVDKIALLPEISQLSLLQGMLSKLPPEVLLMPAEEKGEGKGEGVGEGGDVCLHHKVLTFACDLFDRASTAITSYVGARAIALWTKVTREMCQSGLLAQHQTQAETVAGRGTVMARLVDHIWSHWDNHIEGIPHQMRDIFTNLLTVHETLHADDHSTFVHSLAVRVLNVDPFLKPKYTYSGILADHISVETMLQVCPQLPMEIMDAMNYQSLAPHAGALWAKLVVQHKAESEANQWQTTWLDPMLHILCTGSSLQRSLVAQHCVNSPNLPEGSLEYALKELPVCHGGQPRESGDACLAAQLVCLRALQNRSWDRGAQQGEESSTVIREALRSSNEELKVTAFGMLCERRRTTDAPSVADLSVVMSFLPDNLSSQSPLFRQQIQACLKQLFRRVFDSSLALSKSSKAGQDLPTLVTSMKEFMTAFVDLQFSCLNPVVSFQRRTFALHNLETLSKVTNLVMSDKSRSIAEGDLIYNLNAYLTSSPCARRLLVQTLQDSFEANKEIALQLLLELPVDVDLFEDLQAHIEWCYRMSSSPKAVDCSTAAYNWRLLAARECEDVPPLLQQLNVGLKEHLRDLFGSEIDDKVLEAKDKDEADGKEGEAREDEKRWRRSEEKTRECAPLGGRSNAVMGTLLALTDTLTLHRAAAACSLTAASLHAPMYGVIEAISAILSTSNRSSLGEAELAVLYAKLISECLTIADFCLPVVCNSSPEGFLPSTAMGGGAEGHGSSEGCPTAQSLLLCCWHTMKEISLLFGSMAEQASLQELSHMGSGTLSAQQFHQIGDFFTCLLSQARHRGAFEMAFSGFKQFCCRLWLLPPHPSLLLNCHTPSQWLESGLQSLQTTSTGNITRRSAGLPFYFLAILCSAPPSEVHSLLSHVMEGLVEAVNTAKLSYPVEERERMAGEEDKPLTLDPPSSFSPSELVPEPAAVHALNILRALVRDARLAESVMPFLGHVFILSVNGFSSEHWAVRNSSTMLFSSLMNRIFGVKRVKDEHQMQNKMSSKKLFTQFPMLHGYLQRKLQEAADKVEVAPAEGKGPSPMDPSVFPVLLTLSRLFPSSLDDKDSPTSLEPFKPLVRRFTCSSVWKMRVLASQTLATITMPGEVPSTLTEVGHTLPQSPEQCLSQNHLHGDILLLKELLNQLLVGGKKAAMKNVSECEALFADMISASWIGTSGNSCAVTRAEYAEVLQILVEHLQLQSAKGSGVTDQVLQFVAVLKDDLVKTAVDGNQQGKAGGTIWLLKESLKSQLCLYASLVRGNGDAISEVLKPMLTSLSPTAVEVAMEVCTAALVSKDVHFPRQAFLEVFPVDLCRAGEDMQLTCLQLSTVLVKNSDKDSLSELRDHFNSLFKQVLQLGQQMYLRYDVRMAVLEFMGSWASVSESYGRCWSHEECCATLALVSQTSRDDQLEEVRLSSARVLAVVWWHCLCEHSGVVGSQMLAEQAPLVTAYWKAFLQCLFDSDPAVRETAWLCLNNISQHFKVSEGIVQGEGGPFNRHPHIPTIVRIASNCIVESFSRFPMSGYVFLESQLQEYLTGIFGMGDKYKASVSALLFEEGPINDYREDMVLCNLWCEAIKKLCGAHHSKEDVSRVMGQLYAMTIDNLVKIVDKYSLKLSCQEGTSTLPPLFSKEGSLVILALYSNVNILHFLRESTKAAGAEEPAQWSVVDLCRDTLVQYCCLPPACVSPGCPSSA